ncbi:hypothetical protein DLAC_07102 [Tieghemostelium lacteum]|uniref:Uncharacterized protein n=1 Tax=Tieghemostelium lacteum TaxID=361077 RepID=A0A151ZE97_TIELA|nr:hypothetical protein DLAC_07102 [Tieghemostelium lacteum]|eukprot:KYQ92255.1 hypothetical protein DLAC_07102 [Tieghemostelium lacteum]
MTLGVINLDILLYQLQSIQKIRLVCKDWLNIIKGDIGIKLPKICLQEARDLKTYSFYTKMTKSIDNSVLLDCYFEQIQAVIKQLSQAFYNTRSLNISHPNADCISISKLLKGYQFPKLSSLKFRLNYSYLNNLPIILDTKNIYKLSKELTNTSNMTKITIMNMTHNEMSLKNINYLPQFINLKTLKLENLQIDIQSFIEFLSRTKCLQKLVIDNISASNNNNPKEYIKILMGALNKQESINYLSIKMGADMVPALSIIELLNHNQVLRTLYIFNVKFYQNYNESIRNKTIQFVSDQTILDFWFGDSGITKIENSKLRSPLLEFNPLRLLSNHVNLQSLSVYCDLNICNTIIDYIEMNPKHLTRLEIYDYGNTGGSTEKILLNAIPKNHIITQLKLKPMVRYNALQTFLETPHPTLQDLTIRLIDGFKLSEYVKLKPLCSVLKSLQIQSQFTDYHYEDYQNCKFEDLIDDYLQDLIKFIDIQIHLSVIQIPTPLFYSKRSSFFQIYQFNLNPQQQNQFNQVIKKHQHLHTLILSLDNSNVNALLRDNLIRNFFEI